MLDHNIFQPLCAVRFEEDFGETLDNVTRISSGCQKCFYSTLWDVCCIVFSKLAEIFSPSGLTIEI
jgi:hypothetical protein